MVSDPNVIVEKVGAYHCLAAPTVEIPALIAAFEATPAKRFLEIGTWQGCTCSAMALAFPDADVWTVDLPEPHKSKWNPQSRHKTGSAYRDLKLEHRITQLWMDATDLTQLHGKEQFDMVFIDADHSEEACLRDLNTSKGLLTADGIIVVHDYTDGSDADTSSAIIEAVRVHGNRPPWTVSVYKAVQRFVEQSGFIAERLPGWLVALHQPGSKMREPRAAVEAKKEKPVTLEKSLLPLHELDPERGRAPWRLKEMPVGERVLHLHLGTPEEPQGSLRDALKSLSSRCLDDYRRVDWFGVDDKRLLHHTILSAAKTLKPTLVFMQLQGGGVVDGATLVALRELCADNVSIVHWTGDVTSQYAPTGEHWTKSLSRVCDLMLFSCMTHVRAHREQGMANAAYLQVGYDEARYFRGAPEEYGSQWDVAFLGQVYGLPIISRMTLGTSEAGLRVEIGGRLLRDCGTRAGVFGSGWRGGVVTPAKSGDVYRSSHVAVSSSIASDMERYSSDRLLRALACGVPVLCKRFDDCESWGLKHGDNVFMFDDVEQMARKIANLLGPDAALVRRAVGKAGAELAVQHHTWSVRMLEMMALVEVVRGNKTEVERPW